MLRKLHHRCWVAGTPADVSHHQSEAGANDVVIEHLLQASHQIAIGERGTTCDSCGGRLATWAALLDDALLGMPAAALPAQCSSPLGQSGGCSASGRRSRLGRRTGALSRVCGFGDPAQTPPVWLTTRIRTTRRRRKRIGATLPSTGRDRQSTSRADRQLVIIGEHQTPRVPPGTGRR
jgi:hypothetical protein